jgi:hypothetical protein
VLHVEADVFVKARLDDCLHDGGRTVRGPDANCRHLWPFHAYSPTPLSLMSY